MQFEGFWQVLPNDPTYPARECAQVQPSIGLSFLPLASIWPPFLLLISVRRVLLRRKGMFLLREEYISFVWLITTPRASTSLNRSYIFLETCFSRWDLGILTDGKRLTQGAGWTNSCSKISLLILSAYWLGHLVKFICSADCGSCLGQVSFIKCMFIFTKYISQGHGCLFLHSHQNGWSSWRPSWPWLWFSQFASRSTAEEGKGMLLRASDLEEHHLNLGCMSLLLRCSPWNRQPQHPGDLLVMQNLSAPPCSPPHTHTPPVSESVWTRPQAFMCTYSRKSPALAHNYLDLFF